MLIDIHIYLSDISSFNSLYQLSVKEENKKEKRKRETEGEKKGEREKDYEY